ncbi:ADP-heptose synthase [Tumebacillus sp. ITR2]|uniref:ADP-heptose synthase n=1 Tax=Tumebacillus amylolyticus TaxID=2801339 RepID=A0ABS1J7L9_9BACL|nr:ADP-heptose synthase [Tumebacillus amylolyticus]MBL0386277.1 ADP-heptose synthase [Tumebacillus amylolyticus]
MQRYVLEPVLFAIFGELLYPNEPLEYLIPYSTVMELYELLETDQIVTDPLQNTLVKQHVRGLIEFFEQPLVKKKMDKILRVPWTKSSPILFSENVTFTVVFSIDNAEFGETFDPIETELILLARREQVPIISDQLEFEQRVVTSKVQVTVVDVADFGFLLDDAPEVAMTEEEHDLSDTTPLRLAEEPVQTYEAEEGAAVQEATQEKAKENSMLPYVMGGLVLLLAGSLLTLLWR